MEEKQEKYNFGFKIQKKEPKPDADYYSISDIKQFFRVYRGLSEKDREKMLNEFSESMEVAYHMANAVEGNSGTDEKIDLERFEWWND